MTERVFGWRAMGEVPHELAAAFDACGWSRLAADATTPDGLTVMWVGADWDGALVRLSEVPAERQRARTVLAGVEPPPGIGERVREVGGLAWLAPPWPRWMIVLLQRTLQRSLAERPLHRIRGVQELEAVAGTSQANLLRELAVRAGRLLDTAAEVWIRPGRAGEGGFHPLVSEGPRRCPIGLCETAARFNEPVVISNVAAARVVQVAEHPVGAAIALPLLRDTTPDEPCVVLVLTWAEPFLPTVGEFRLLEMIGLVGRLSLRRIYERDRLVEAHAAHVRALSSMLPRHPPARRAEEATAGQAEPTADDLVERVLATRATHPDLLELQARLSPDSRGGARWHVWARRPTVLSADALELALEWLAPGHPGRQDDGTWLMTEHVGPDGALGQVVAVFASRNAAIAGAAALSDVAVALALGAQVLRWSADTTALTDLSDAATRVSAPEPALTRMIARICERMAADGARLWVVHRSALGPRLQLQLTWPVEQETPPPPAELEDAVREGRWLRAATEGGSCWHLLVPLGPGDRPAGVLEIWRSSAEPFDDQLDPEALVRFAPHVAAAVRRVMHHALQRARLKAMADLLAELEPARGVPEAARRVAERVGTLAGAAAAVLLRRSPEREGPVYAECIWALDQDFQEAAAQAMLDCVIDRDPVPWTTPAGPQVEAAVHAWGLTQIRHRVTIPSPHAEGAQPTSAFVLFDRVDADDFSPLAPEIQDEAATELVHYAAALMENATRGSARWAAERLAKASPQAGELLEWAAKAIIDATGVDAVVLSVGDRTGSVVRHVSPERKSLLGLPMPVSGPRVEPDQVEGLARTFGWTGVRAAELVPIEDRGRQIGQLLVLTNPSGPWIGWHRRQVLRSVAARLALELDKVQRRAMLEDLNNIAGRLTGLVGEALGRRAVEELTHWMHRYVRVNTEVVIVARAHNHQTLLLAGPPALGSGELRALNQASRRWGRVPHAFRPKDIEEELGALARWGVATPFGVRDNGDLTGHLIVLSHAPIDDGHAPALREAARELAIVLEAERVRHGFMAEAGLFRHALLSPVQGLQDAALFLADLWTDEEASPELVEEQRDRIYIEAEKVRQWRTVQRMYGGGLLGGDVTIRPRRQALRPVIELCMDRFRVSLRRRGVDLGLDWQVRGGIHVTFDADALDIALSNLLDNAAKYTFAHRPISVGVHAERQRVLIWVQDIGHPVPEHVDIYAAGERLTWEDPFRTIHGDGLGLVIVRSLIHAHGGALQHECRAENPHPPKDQREDTRPWIVRFTISLPID